MTDPDQFREMGAKAVEQAGRMNRLASQLRKLSGSVDGTVGGTATKADRTLIGLLEQAAAHSAKAAVSFQTAQKSAEKAARQIEHERAEAARRKQAR